MSTGLHPTIMLDLVSATASDRRRAARERDQRAARRSAKATGASYGGWSLNRW